MEKKVFIGQSSAEIIEKKSRFIGTVKEVHSEAEALSFIEALRKQYWDARHNCFAYVIGENNETQRFSDDKEPQGTAGKPILDVLLGNNMRNTLIVVTRYFGGVLLGTGGLVRAYSSAAGSALKSGNALDIINGTALSITCDYNSSGKIQYLLGTLMETPEIYGAIALSGTAYGENVCFDIMAEEKSMDTLIAKVTEITQARAIIEKKDAVTFAIKDGIPVVYKF